ncbi:unnamed protein product [Ilex paraguariensis]|uniref:Uncharacterized protein n=1 Tax=Ilex paraguariensis TaxID=185542 RepID=A0ABC8URF2_9AQUA
MIREDGERLEGSIKSFGGEDEEMQSMSALDPSNLGEGKTLLCEMKEEFEASAKFEERRRVNDEVHSFEDINNILLCSDEYHEMGTSSRD